MRTEIDGKHILLSIQPHFANKIFEGTKSVELRKSIPKFHQNRIVILYVSTPVKAIIGGFKFSHFIEEEPSKLWQNVQNLAGISEEQFNSYYSGKNNGYGIFINQVWKYHNPISLKELRNSFSNFSPPQNFRYLNKQHVNNFELLNLNQKDFIQQH